MKVGIVLAPLLFGGVGLGLWAVIPDPAGKIIGLVLLQAGFLVMLFLLWYARRSARRAPSIAFARVDEWLFVQGRHGQQSMAVEATVEAAYELTPEGPGDELPELRHQKKRMLLVSPEYYERVAVGAEALLVCMPTGELVIAEGRYDD